MIVRLSLVLFLSWTIIACGDSTTTPKVSHFEVTEPSGCSQKERNQFIYDVLKDSYLWSDKVGVLDISLEMEDSAFLDHFLYKKKDRFSFILSKEIYNQQFTSGESSNLGFLSAQVRNSVGDIETKVAYVYEASPAYKVGLKRGDTILSLEDINSSYEMKIRTNEGVTKTLYLEEMTYVVSSVSHAHIFDVGGKRVGYFFFKSFVGPRLITELDNVFSYFKRESVDELIVDLRYNGGGLLSVAAHLGSLIGGIHVENHIFQKNRYNPKYSALNSTTYFEKRPSNSLDLSRVFFIMTENSASASESLVNAMCASDNHIETIIIGKASYGKPFGMHVMPYCDKVLVPIQFADENSDGVGEFIDGLAPTCEIDETFNKDFAKVDETLINGALFYLQMGHCP